MLKSGEKMWCVGLGNIEIPSEFKGKKEASEFVDAATRKKWKELQEWANENGLNLRVESHSPTYLYSLYVTCTDAVADAIRKKFGWTMVDGSTTFRIN